VHAGGPLSFRELSQTKNTRCPVGCAEGGCIMDASAGGYRCNTCLRQLVTIESDGRCGCPAGKHINLCTQAP
jgi:hypothetical protein